MASNSQLPEGRDGAHSTLDTGIETLNSAKETSTITPAKTAFGSAGVLLKTIKESAVNRKEYTGIGLHCAEICGVLDRKTKGKRTEDLSQSVHGAINELTTTVAEIQGKVIKQSQRNTVSRFLRTKNEKENIAAWRSDLDRILQIFNTELAIDTNVVASGTRHDVSNALNIVSETQNTVSDTHNVVSDTHNIVSDIHRAVVKHQGGSDGANLPTQESVHGESPPPPPRACFGRNDLIEKVVGLAERLEPVALIGAGGIGKTSIALTVLHNDRIKKRFGDHRRFIRCDQFPASLPHLLNRLSTVVGANIENPEDLTPLRPFLSSREMIIFLDNAESILDPQGADARRIYSAVEELSRFPNICFGITSRISTIPPHFKRPIVSTLSTESACNIFYSIYDNGGQSEVISDLVKKLDFHALSITLFATTASHNMWDYNELAEEWNAHRAQVLRTDYESLAATIELSLASPTFLELGPHARDLLGVVAFFPQGVDKNNLDWLFPTIPDRKNIFNKLCVLSLTSRSNNFITMLAPIRDHLCPQDPSSSPLLCAAKDHYFSRLSVAVDPGIPGFEEARWVVSEDVNIEYLLDAFMSIDPNSDIVWDTCACFMEHLYWHKRRYTVLGPKNERLTDNHRSKPICLFELSRLSESVGNFVEQRRLLTHALKLAREEGDDSQVAHTLLWLSHASQSLDLYKEGIQQTEESLAIYERLGDTINQARCWGGLTTLLCLDGQINAAEEAASRTFDLLPEEGQEFLVCQSHRSLASIYRFKGERERTVHHLGKALGIASAFEWQGELFQVHHSLATLFLDEDGLEGAHDHIDQAKLHAADNVLGLGWAMQLKAQIWYRQHRLEDAISQTLGAIEIFERVGASRDAVRCKGLLHDMEQAMHVVHCPAPQ